MKQTAGREILGDFAPEFAHLNDDILFGEVWDREDKLSRRDRSLITVTALMTSGMIDSSFVYHMTNAKKNGITKMEIAEVFTHLAFYCGWPKAWAAFRMAKEVWIEDSNTDLRETFEKNSLFPIGKPNDGFAKFFVGQSYLQPITTAGIPIFNVTFEPGCRNNWHIHKAEKGGGQILLCVAGKGWYQEEGQEARKLLPGDSVVIPAGVKHWHGAARDSWFSHLAVEVPGEGASNEWLEAVSESQYEKL